MAWSRVTRPLHLGGLGVPNLEIMVALRMRWLWLKKSEPEKPWAMWDMQFLEVVKAMFRISVMTIVSDGCSTLFWTDPWINGKSIQDLAPDLMPFIKRRGWHSRTVQDALTQDSWLQDVVGGLPVMLLGQFLSLWDMVTAVELVPGERDVHVWTPCPSGSFSSKSAYQRYFVGGIKFEPHK